MIDVYLGTTGSGKTSCLTFHGYMNYLSGYNLISNYRLIGMNYIPLNTIDDLLSLKGDKFFLCGDELWQDMDSRMGYTDANKLRKFVKQMLQHRKRKIKMGITAQHFSQIDRRVRNIVQEVYFPQIIAKDETGKPYILEVTNFNLQNPNKVKKFRIPLIIPGVYSIPDMYDTFEVVDELNDNENENLEELIEKYLDTEYNTKTQLKSYILLEEKIKHDNKWLNERMAANVADYIDLIRTTGVNKEN